MTPTEQDIEFFKEAKRIQEEWEPKIGDWFLYVDEEPKIVDEELFVIMRGFGYTDEHIWLPYLDQLIEMLEERGWAWRVAYYYGSEWDNREYEATLAKCDAIHSNAKGTDDRDFVENVRGPTPSIALGRALIEALKEEWGG